MVVRHVAATTVLFYITIMTEHSGILVVFIQANNTTQAGVVRYMKQHSTFVKSKRSLVTLLTDKQEYMRTNKGKKISVLKKDEELTQIGFID